MVENKQLSRASVLRMELYLDVLQQCRAEGRRNITSAEIGEAVGVSPESVRQDLFKLGTTGKPMVGYEVDKLISLLRSVFGLDTLKKICLVGYGNLGRALANSNIWDKAGFELAAIFDKDPNVVGTGVGPLKVRNLAEVFGVVKSEGIVAGVIATPASVAQEIANILVNAGIKAIWNFAPVKLHVPEGVVVENQSLAWGLITLSQAMKSVFKE